MATNNVILDKSFQFAVRIVKLTNHLRASKKEYIITDQLMRSGMSIGANAREAVESFSKREFTYKMGISLKEARECEYWIDLLKGSGYLSNSEYDSIHKDCIELLKILIAIVKTSKDIKK